MEVSRGPVANIVPGTRFLRIKCPFFCHLVGQQEVNQSLVDDGLVDMDKIGSSNFFWSFPSKMAVTKQNIVDTLKQKITKVMTGGFLSFRFAEPNVGI